ncbi:sperm flagellar protein 2 isoform X3 [Betta splendens]|uniref:Sperm flagellar protein 2 isoform X3 n=1 Tax=Betta splendens TaxID=158456 RepID=A0A6P7NGY6_BETSP|nr:sperm flagellar protein 2 isoform X3 [Betta splendens]
MSEILCRWLNQELQLSKAVEPKTFAKDFSSGYLIGEVLHKYQLQNDFSMFMKNDTSISKLNNFTRLEPTLHLLGISFNLNTAQELIQEKQGVATHLLYQLYVSLEKKKRVEISRTMLEMMQPVAIANLHKKEFDNYSDRLHHVVKRDTELKLQKISQHYQEKFQLLNDRSVVPHPIYQNRQLLQSEKRVKNIEKLRLSRQRHNGIMPFNPATIIQVPKPPSYTSKFSLKKTQQEQQQQRRQSQVQKVQTEIDQFETNRKKLLVTPGFASSTSGQPFHINSPLVGSSLDCEVPESGTKLILQSNSKYIQEIRQRLKENATAQEHRAKRRERFIVEQLKAHEAHEESKREDQLVKRLTRQTQQEQRLAAQLLQIRMQKDVIFENRLAREQQYQQRREKDFQEALEREAALAQQAKLDFAENIRKELELFNKTATERSQIKHQKHFKTCKDILEQIVDLATKVGEYRLLAGLIPEKQMREWKELLVSGLPLYEPIESQQTTAGFSTILDPVELQKQKILNNQDYDEYTNMAGEWVWPEEAGAASFPPTNNNILGHVVLRLRNIVHPPVMELSTQQCQPCPHFTLKACVLGKFCSGKTTCLTKMAEAHGIYVLSADRLIMEALNAYHDGAVSQAMQGAVVEEELRKGNVIPNELLVDIIVEAIRQVPVESGWILDGFPVDITQAHLLEKALGGSVSIRSKTEDSRTNLAAHPNPPTPPPPPSPVLNLALLLDIPDESVVRRAYSHIETNSAADTGSSPIDQNLYLAQISNRLTAFQDSWPKLEKWFGGKQNILVRVDANTDEDELYKRVEAVLLQLMSTKSKDGLDSGKPPDSSTSDTPLPVDQPLAPADEAPVPMESTSNLKAENDQNEMSINRTNTQATKEPSRKASVCSVTYQDTQGVTENSLEATAPYPGSTTWVYVDEPLPPEVPEHLCSYWGTVCDSYVSNIKTVMQQLRTQHTFIHHHLFSIRERFKHYLERPDLMQELVCEWQKDFNSISDDMREDEDTKAELHLRLDELRERLWDISDKSKELDEQERTAFISDGWLEDHISQLIEHHSRLIQVELDRFQETATILKVYYSSMCKQVLPEPHLACIPPLTTLKMKDESAPPHPKRPDTSREAVKMKDQRQPEPVKTRHEELMFHYEEATKIISNLVSAEVHQGETKEQKEKDWSDSKNPETSQKIHEEYAAALDHEEKAAKVRIALVKGHGLQMVHTLESRAEQTFTNMQSLLEAHYLAEMKSIDQLTEVVCHHIEAGAKLQNPLVLECTDFYLNGDCHMVANPLHPLRPAAVEKPTLSTPTIDQLESLCQQLYNVSPSGLMSSSEFFRLLRDLSSVSMCRNTLPEPWIDKNETKLKKIVSVLTDHHELIDWRRFLLSAALPWPLPSLTELLLVLQRFRAADNGNTGYINKEQYLKTELWFYSESVQSVPEDPSEPLPYDRLDNLRKFFFQLFADHSFSSPRLDYVSMLLYFAAHLSPRQGFIRALSVVLGHHLRHSSPDQLVISMPNIEVSTELTSSNPDEEHNENETLCSSNSSLGDQEVSVPALLAVICYKATKIKVFPQNWLSDEEQTQHLVSTFRELGYSPDDYVPFNILCQHPFIQGLMDSSTRYQLINIHSVLLDHQGEEESKGSSVS